MHSAFEVIRKSSQEYKTHGKFFLIMTLLLIFPLFLFRTAQYPNYPFSAFKLFLWASPLDIPGIGSPFAAQSIPALLKSLPYILVDGFLIPILVFLPIVQRYLSHTTRTFSRIVTDAAGKIPQLFLLQFSLTLARLLCFFILTGLYTLYQFGTKAGNDSFMPWICLLIFAVCLAICILLPFWIAVSGFSSFAVICQGQSAFHAVIGCIRLMRKRLFSVLWDYFKVNFLLWLPYVVLFLITARTLARVYNTEGLDLTLYFAVYVLLYAILYPIKVRSLMTLHHSLTKRQ